MNHWRQKHFLLPRIRVLRALSRRRWAKEKLGKKMLMAETDCVVDHIMWVQIYLGTFETEQKRQDLEILVWRSCPLKAPSSLSSDNAWQGPKLPFYFQKLKERIPAKLGNVHLLPCKYVSYIFQRERERRKKSVYKSDIHIYIYIVYVYMIWRSVLIFEFWMYL